jgi:NAD(P)-dependent dehydrogenase (short-subunit alcohol dehydrogenase family)/ketosteroid isomerase-like protein
VKAIGSNVTGVQGDAANLGDLDRLFAQIKNDKGTLDIVFANAGMAKYAPLGTITEELFDSTFNTNVRGLLFTVQKALSLLPDGSSIILNASIVASKGLASNSVYSATKAAVRSFARTWTTDLKDRRIRVNAVSPGSIDTPGLNRLLGSSEVGRQRLKTISNSVPLGRLGKPDEIAKAVVFLASDDASFVTGAELFVDGGFRAGLGGKKSAFRGFGGSVTGRQMTADELVRTHQGFNGAVVRNDLAELSKFYADDYMLVRPDGSMFSKEQILTELKAHPTNFRSIESSNEKLRVYGQVGILTGDNQTVTLRDGQESKSRSRFLAIYFKRGDRIELVHFQSNNLPS